MKPEKVTSSGNCSGVLALELHISRVLWDWLDWEEQDGIWSLVWGCLLLLDGQCLNYDEQLELEIHGPFQTC